VPDRVLGFDFGTSSVKAALFGPGGELLASARAAYPLHLPAPGHAEQSPADWWSAMAQTTRQILAQPGVRRDSIAALGIAAQMCGTIPVDSAGEPLHPCLTWLDTRSAGVARRITAGGPRIAGYGVLALWRWLRLTGGAPNLSGKDPISKIVWLREARPEIWRRSARFLDVKDWILHRCTGRFATTADCAQLTWLMDNRDGRRRWSGALAGRVGVPLERLPEIVPACEVAGTLTAAAAAQLDLPPGLPVSGGAGDVAACALGSGAQALGAEHLHLGSSLWFAAPAAGRRVDPLHSVGTLCAAEPERYLAVATQESAGTAVLWAARALGFGDGAEGVRTLEAAALRAGAGEHTPDFIPWLQGERTPVDDPCLRGGFAGVGIGCAREDLAYAALAGVALNARWALECLHRLIRPSAPEITLVGGGARSAVWAQIFADVLQRPLRVPHAPELAGARGAAITAAVAVGLRPGPASDVAQPEAERVHQPSAAMRDWAAARYARLLGYHRATRSWHRAAYR
jgi:xylulokinase